MKTNNIFRNTSWTVGVVMVFLSLSLFIKGLIPSMADFKVPENVLASEHYYDAIFWVYLHMCVVGILIVCIGYGVTDVNKQKWISLIITFFLFFYTYLDFIHSDSVLGNALYKGKSSIVPAIISLLMTLFFIRLTYILFKTKV